MSVRGKAAQVEHGAVREAEFGGDVGRCYSSDADQTAAAVSVQCGAERALEEHGAHVAVVGAAVRRPFVWFEQIANFYEWSRDEAEPERELAQAEDEREFEWFDEVDSFVQLGHEIELERAEYARQFSTAAQYQQFAHI